MDNFKKVIEKYTSKEEMDKMKAIAIDISKKTAEKAKEVADVLIEQADKQIQAYKARKKDESKNDETKK